MGRIVIDDVRPRTPAGYPPKGVTGHQLAVSADIFRDGHDVLAARVRWRPSSEKTWRQVPMAHLGNDRWEASFTPDRQGPHLFVVEGWTDRYATWRRDVLAKHGALQPVEVELEEGARLVEDAATKAPKARRQELAEVAAALRDASRETADRLLPALTADVADLVGEHVSRPDLTASAALPVWIDRPRAEVGAWYEFFPRSEGGLEGAAKRLRAVADMGFDVVYLPPVHPIGHSFRKGRNNTLDPGPGDPGSPWAIGSEDGGHTAVHPQLGTLDDFDSFVAEAESLGLEVALDYALQCSPDHPWVREHPEWFHHRPDGTIKYAENPPKKYQDIYPINFWPPEDHDRVALWTACKEILDFWIDHGVHVFRVDNPHTKPLAFWEWLIPAVQTDHPEVVFLAEAFTRPKMMAKLAEVGFSQSYTYFTWRTTKQELVEYLTELTQGPTADYMRPNFWPNTPDILSGPLRNGPPAAFRLRLVLAATLVPSYGVYSGYELCENQPASPLNEEYLDSEKYEIKSRDWDDPGSLAPLITRLNDIRRRHPAFHALRNIQFQFSHNDSILAYTRRTGADVVLIVVNLDPVSPHEDMLWVDLASLGLPWDRPLVAYDELTGVTYQWQGGDQYVRLDPALQPAHVLHLRPVEAQAP